MLTPARNAAIEQFLSAAGWSGVEHRDLAGDASTRRYQRLHAQTRSSVLMIDGEDGGQLPAFLAVQRILTDAGLSVPRVITAAPGQGLALLEDFGDDTYTRLLDQGAAPLALYRLAIDALRHVHACVDIDDPPVAALPRYGRDDWIDIVRLFADGYVAAHGQPPTATAVAEYEEIWHELLARTDGFPKSLLLRDFHAGNLFHLPGRSGVAACGLIDFQDAGVGSVLYDPISLLEDARRDLERDVFAECQMRFRASLPPHAPEDFEAAWSALALQRHLRVIAVFDRLARAGDDRYVAHLPRVWGYVEKHLRAPAAARLAAWLDRHLKSRLG